MREAAESVQCKLGGSLDRHVGSPWVRACQFSVWVEHTEGPVDCL